MRGRVSLWARDPQQLSCRYAVNVPTRVFISVSAGGTCTVLVPPPFLDLFSMHFGAGRMYDAEVGKLYKEQTHPHTIMWL